MTTLHSIPCTLITGFLGVGKTTIILNLLKQKPAHEKWAVLVNEFGEIGLDGAIMEAKQTQNDVFIKEVPGGCMCCASGLPMQIALNMLLMKAKPDRLIIEPTGLGHPKEVLKVLRSEHYQEILEVQHTITVIDARHFSSPKHLNNPIFKQQLEVADVLVANKADLYEDADLAECKRHIESHPQLSLKPFFSIENGIVNKAFLETYLPEKLLKKTFLNSTTLDNKAEAAALERIQAETIPETGFIFKSHYEDEYSSMGWRFAADLKFDLNKLQEALEHSDFERIKAVFMTKDGEYSLNIEGQAPFCFTRLEQALTESRLELIQFDDENINKTTRTNKEDIWTKRLLSCLV